MDGILERQPFNGYFMILPLHPPFVKCGCHMQFKFPCRHHVFVYYHNTDVNLNATLQSTLVEWKQEWYHVIDQHLTESGWLRNTTMPLFNCSARDGVETSFTMDFYLNSNRLALLLLSLITSIVTETHLSPKNDNNREQHCRGALDSGRKRLLSMGTLSSRVFSIVRKQRR